MSDDQIAEEGPLSLTLNIKEQKILRTALKTLGGLVSSRDPRDFNAQELADVRALRARLPEKA